MYSKKQRDNSHTINHLFAEEYHYDGEYNIETRLLLTQYNAGDLQHYKLDVFNHSFINLFRPDCINWYNVTGLNNTVLVQKLIKEFGFFPVDAKPVLTPCHAAKIDAFGNRLIIVVRPCFFDKENSISSEHICILVKENVIITFQEQGIISFDNVMMALRTNLMNIRAEGQGMLIAFLLNVILSVMIGTAIRVENMLENIDQILLKSEISDITIGKKIQECSSANLFLQKNTIPLKDEFGKLLHIPMIKDNNTLMPVYLELYNQLDYVLLTSQSCKDLLSSQRDLYVSNNELKTNSIMKRLTILATLFIPVTFLAGLWGMNFEFMPEVSWRYGYILALGLMLVTVLFTWFYMKKNKWF